MSTCVEQDTLYKGNSVCKFIPNLLTIHEWDKNAGFIILY